MNYSRTLTILSGCVMTASLALGQPAPRAARPVKTAEAPWPDQATAPPTPRAARPAIAREWPDEPPAPPAPPAAAWVEQDAVPPQPPAPPVRIARPAIAGEWPAEAPMPPTPPVAIWLEQDAVPPQPPVPAVAPIAPRAFNLDLDVHPDVHLDLDYAFDQDFAANVRESVQSALAEVRSNGLGFGRIGQGFAFAPQTPMPSPAVRTIRMSGSDDRLYNQGQNSIDEHRWDDALQYFSQVAARAGSRADGALYWKAYVLNRLGRRDEALAAIAELRKTYASSRWMDDAKALEIEVNQSAGKPVSPDAESDEELKILALNGLMRSDPDRALPLVENLLKTGRSPSLKKKALFVLTQSSQPRAAAALEQVARGSSGNPDLQLTAIRYFGESSRKQPNGGTVLMEIYTASNDLNVKRAVLNAFGSARDKEHVLQVATSEKNTDLRLEALRMLNPATNQNELWKIYQGETSPEVKQQILDMMNNSANTDKLLEIAKTEKDTKLRRSAIRNLGSFKNINSGDALVGVYANEPDQAIKMVIVETLYSQRNAKALVDIVKKEQDTKMKRDIVRYLSNMKDPAATEYLMEILK